MLDKTPRIPENIMPLETSGHLFQSGVEDCNAWLIKVMHNLGKEKSDDDISWAAYYASQQPPLSQVKSLGVMLTLFHEKVHSVPMIRH